jgi:hypothetical protein
MECLVLEGLRDGVHHDGHDDHHDGRPSVLVYLKPEGGRGRLCPDRDSESRHKFLNLNDSDSICKPRHYNISAQY